MFCKIKLLFLLFATSIVCTPKQPLTFAYDELRWNWNEIEPMKQEDLQLPKNFLWGVSTSAHQVEGNCNCQWIEFEKKNKLEESAQACDHWNKYKEDIELIKNLGVKSYRFSVEWSKIEPEEGVIDQEAIQHYHDLIDNLVYNGITPMITLHHFTHPIWFEEKGAFENEDNIKYIVRFAQLMFSEYSSKVPMWCTLNEPGVYAFQGYLSGAFPPGKKDIELAGIINRNLILTHIQIYKALKAMENGDKCQIGITHSITQFNSYKKFNHDKTHAKIKGIDPMGKIEEFIAYYLNHIFYRAMMDFFITGEFNYNAPTIVQLFLTGTLPKRFQFTAKVKYNYWANENKPYNPAEILDFFGVQPYSNVLVDYKNTNAAKVPSLRAGDIATDMPYRICAESLYRAVHEASYIGVPIYITETGIADAKDDRRELFIKRYLYATNKAIKDGYDVRGFFYWSLYDNFEWNLGYGMKFGLYEVDFKTQQRRLRQGGQAYKNIVQNQIIN